MAMNIWQVDPNSNLPFHVYTDASYYQACTIITHNGKLVEACQSQKLKEEQENYSTVLEKEMLSVILCLKSFHTISIGNNKTDAAIQMLGMDPLLHIPSSDPRISLYSSEKAKTPSIRQSVEIFVAASSSSFEVARQSWIIDCSLFIS